MKIKNSFTTRCQFEEPQEKQSITIPGQAPTLRYIVSQLMQGNQVNVRNMRYDNEPTLDDFDTRFLDNRNAHPSDIDRVLEMYYPTPDEVPAE